MKKLFLITTCIGLSLSMKAEAEMPDINSPLSPLVLPVIIKEPERPFDVSYEPRSFPQRFGFTQEAPNGSSSNAGEVKNPMQRAMMQAASELPLYAQPGVARATQTMYVPLNDTAPDNKTTVLAVIGVTIIFLLSFLCFKIKSR